MPELLNTIETLAADWAKLAASLDMPCRQVDQADNHGAHSG